MNTFDALHAIATRWRSLGDETKPGWENDLRRMFDRWCDRHGVFDEGRATLWLEVGYALIPNFHETGAA